MMNSRYAGLPYPDATVEYCPVSTFLRDLFTRCREGKKDPDLRIHTSAAAITPDVAQIVGTTNPELTVEYLTAAEQSLPDVGFRYVTLYKAGKPVLFAYYQLFSLTPDNFNLSNDRDCVRHIISLFLKLKKARVLVLGNALRTDTASFCCDRNTLTAQEALDAIAAITERLAKSEDVSGIILPGISNNNKTAFATAGYSTPWEDNVMQLDLRSEWEHIDDYVASLTRKYKARTKKVLEATSSLQLIPVTEDKLQQYEADITRLFSGVIDNQSFVLTPSGANYITALKKLYKDDFEISMFLSDGKPVAFISAFITNDTYEVFYVGFDAQLNKTQPLYFRLLLAGLEQAIRLNKANLKLGRTSFDAKASLGAKPQQKDYLFKVRRLPQAAIKWFANYFSSLEDAHWKLRNPLKVQG